MNAKRETDTSPVTFRYAARDDPDACTTKKCDLPSGVTAACYANQDTLFPNQDQFCGYVQDGVMYGAKGCCDPPCPSDDCPSIKPRIPAPFPPRTSVDKSAKKSPETVKTTGDEPTLFYMSRFVTLILIAFLVLLVSAFIFISIDL